MLESFNKEQYLKQVEMYYSGDRKNRERFLQDMEDSLDCYLEDFQELLGRRFTNALEIPMRCVRNMSG